MGVVQPNYNTNMPTFNALQKTGMEFRFDPTYAGGPVFIHTQAIIRDAGTRNAMALVGSQNSGDNVSMNAERELRMHFGKDTQIDRMKGVFDEDWLNGTPLTYTNGSLVDPFWITYPSPTP